LYRNTGVAIVNPNPVSADLTLKLTTRDGEVRTRTLTIGPNAHVSKFVTELFNGSIPPDFQGSLDVTSSVSVATLTLRLTVNQRGTAIYSTLPVADLLNPPQGQQFIPQIVNGGGYKTQIIVVDTSGQGGDILLSLFNNQGQLLQGLVFPDEQ
jgi:hypothetical protein